MGKKLLSPSPVGHTASPNGKAMLITYNAESTSFAFQLLHFPEHIFKRYEPTNNADTPWQIISI